MQSAFWHWFGIVGAVVYLILMVCMRIASHWFNSDNPAKAKIAGLYMIYVGGYPDADRIALEMQRRSLL